MNSRRCDQLTVLRDRGARAPHFARLMMSMGLPPGVDVVDEPTAVPRFATPSGAIRTFCTLCRPPGRAHGRPRRPPAAGPAPPGRGGRSPSRRCPCRRRRTCPRTEEPAVEITRVRGAQAGGDQTPYRDEEVTDPVIGHLATPAADQLAGRRGTVRLGG